MYTYQDFVKDAESNLPYAISKAITQHRISDVYKTSVDADRYDAQQNTTIMQFTKKLYGINEGNPDLISSSNRLCSNFFRRLNTQRVTYSMGNGMKFGKRDTEKKLGYNFEQTMQSAGYYGCIHGITFLFWNLDHVHNFKITEFAPLWDEEDGTLKAGIRFWRLDENKPSKAVLYEIDGYTVFEGSGGFSDFRIKEDKRAYMMTYAKAPADAEAEIIGEENYNGFPIIPLYGSRLKQSTLVGMKAQIDAYDLVRSGFADDLAECSEIYWLIGNAGGMLDSDLAKFRRRLKLEHIASIPDVDDVSVTPYTQEIPYQSRKAFLDDIRAGIYEDFGGLDVHTVSAGATNDHIDAAYQPLDENADDYELQIIEAVHKLLALLNIEDTPIFKRNRISNEKETTEMILASANYLDDETVLNLLPFVSPDMVESIMIRKEDEVMKRYEEPAEEPTDEDEE
jgi:hypothetical protein